MITKICPKCKKSIEIEADFYSKTICPYCSAHLFIEYDEYYIGDEEHQIFDIYEVTKEDYNNIIWHKEVVSSYSFPVECEC